MDSRFARFVTIGVGLCILLLSAGQSAAAENKSETVMLELPRGDAAAGQAVFLKMECNRCHRVSSHPEFPERTSATPGPTLSAFQGAKSPAELAMSVFSPSHDISGTLRGPHEEGKSPMPDFTQAITVRQFVDVIAFLDSLDGK